MKYFVYFLAVLTLASAAYPAEINLPPGCVRLLDNKLPGWKFQEVSGEISAFHAKKRLGHKPNLVKGDWNGDGRVDYAALIRQGKSEVGGREEDGRHLVVFLRTAKGYRYFHFEGSDVIWVLRKGARGYDYEKQKGFVYQTDSVFNYIWEKAGESLVWKKGKFERIITSD